jgi:hypothetical protein
VWSEFNKIIIERIYGVTSMESMKEDHYARNFLDVDSLLDFARTIWLGEFNYIYKRSSLAKVNPTKNKARSLGIKNTSLGNKIEQEELSELALLLEFERQFSALLDYSQPLPLDNISKLCHFYRVIRIEEILNRYQTSSFEV